MGIRGKGAKHEEAVAVAIDKDKGSQNAIKWAVDYLLSRGQGVTLLHVKPTTSHHHLHHQTGEGAEEVGKVHRNPTDPQAKELFLPFRGFCSKKAIKCHEVIVDDTDIPKALINYVLENSIEVLVLGGPSKNGILRFISPDVPSIVSKKAPEFCTVYVITKGKISHVRSATIGLPPKAPSQNQLMKHQYSNVSDHPNYDAQITRNQNFRAPESPYHPPHNPHNPHQGQLEDMIIKSPFARAGRATMNKSYELSSESDISYVSCGTPGRDHMFPSFYDSVASGMTPRHSINSELESRSSTSSYSGTKFIDMSIPKSEFSSSSFGSGHSWSSQNNDDAETEMRRLRQELKQTRDLYNTACRETLAAKHKEKEVNRWKLEEELRLEDARLGEEAALAIIQREKTRCKAAMEAAEAAQRIAELEAEKRRCAEMLALKETEERKKAQEERTYDLRYRKYTIEEIEAATHDFSGSLKIGEGGYGPVYRGELDHTVVAIKVLRPDAAQGKSQFKQEIEVLSCIRHPNMVLLLGACPEYGCLVYEYMANGSLEDCLFRKGNTPVIPWQLRFRIAAEIATGLLFLHQTKPEPLVHRDLKPANILLDHNYVSKISDVGLARLVPPSVSNAVTQYHMTSAAGTFCYIDPEYQQTGMLGTKSDVYSLGVLFLQLITAKPPMGLTHLVEDSIETGNFAKVLDPAVPDWPVEEALKFANLALQCAEMRRKDRPDLGNVVLPELERLRVISNDSLHSHMFRGGAVFASGAGTLSTRHEVMSDPNPPHFGYDSSMSHSSTSSHTGRRLF